MSYSNLGTVYSDTGDLEKAKEYFVWALKIQKEKLGANHVDVAMSYNNLGTVYSKTGYLEKAKEYHQLAVKIRPEQLGANHVDVAASYNDLGTVYSDTSDLEKAKESGPFTPQPQTLPPKQAILAPSVKVPLLKKKSPSESISSRGRN